MSEQEIRSRLYLDSAQHFRWKAIRHNLDPDRLEKQSPERQPDALFRCTGRTTNVIVSALAQLEKGKGVVVKADTIEMEKRIRDQILDYARSLGIEAHSRVTLHSEWKKSWHMLEDHPLP